MSDSESKDSDEGIRYKTENVRNKIKITDFTRNQSRGSCHKDKDGSRYRERNSRSPLKKDIEKRYRKKRKRERSASSSSTSSSADASKSKFTKKESQKDKTCFQKIGSHLQKEAILLNDQKQVIQNEIIGPTLPPHLLSKNIGNSNSHMTKNIVGPYNSSSLESGTKIKEQLPGCRSPSPSIDQKLPPHMINTKSESCIGPELLAHLSTHVVKQHQPVLEDTHPQLPSYIGPQLPHHLLSSNIHSEDHKPTRQVLFSQASPLLTSSSRSLKNVEDIMIGPSLPPHLRKNLQEEIQDPCSKSNMQTEDHSQSLSSSLKISQEKDTVKTIGPSLPPDLREKLQEEINKYGSEINMEAEEEEYVYGPLPAGILNNSLSHKALEERALQLKIDQLEPKGSNEPVRESWMIELPAAKASNLGLGPRQFRNRSGPDMSDRSSWTDLPEDKKKKKKDVPVDLRAEAELRELKKRDEEQEILTKKHKRKAKSLLKMHKEKIQKEKKNDKPSERRPFSRDIDLQVNRFDDAQKQAIMKKAQLLDDRFSSGNSKYL